MIGQPRSLAARWELFRDPATAEKRALLAERWAGLDPALRLPGQGSGTEGDRLRRHDRHPAPLRLRLHRLLSRP